MNFSQFLPSPFLPRHFCVAAVALPSTYHPNRRKRTDKRTLLKLPARHPTPPNPMPSPRPTQVLQAGCSCILPPSPTDHPQVLNTPIVRLLLLSRPNTPTENPNPNTLHFLNHHHTQVRSVYHTLVSQDKTFQDRMDRRTRTTRHAPCHYEPKWCFPSSQTVSSQRQTYLVLPPKDPNLVVHCMSQLIPCGQVWEEHVPASQAVRVLVNTRTLVYLLPTCTASQI